MVGAGRREGGGGLEEGKLDMRLRQARGVQRLDLKSVEGVEGGCLVEFMCCIHYSSIHGFIETGR